MRMPPVVKLFRTAPGWRLEVDGRAYTLPAAGAASLTTRDDLRAHLLALAGTLLRADEPEPILPPIEQQEVWAAGVTYFRSRTARMDESKDAGGGSFYDRVYAADRPELFFKASPHRVAGDGQTVRIRSDSKWNVPEPELTLLISPAGTLLGYTIGNDMSSRDIEGENPLYLPQAKAYHKACGLGPGILVTSDPLPASTAIQLEVRRGGRPAFAGETTLAELKRDPADLVRYLFRENSFPQGCFLLTGTGIVPPDAFTLQRGDEIEIRIDPIGTLRNIVE